MTLLALEDGALTISLHSVTIAVGIGQIALLLRIGGPLLREYKMWIRAKERLNQMWRRHCLGTGDEYTPIEQNGKH